MLNLPSPPHGYQLGFTERGYFSGPGDSIRQATEGNLKKQYHQETLFRRSFYIVLAILDNELTEMGAPKLGGERTHCSNVPNDQLPVNTGRTNLGNCPTLPFVRSHARDSVLVYGEQFRFSLRACGATTGDAPGICILEGIKSRAIQPPWSTRTEPGGGESGFRSRCVVETSDKLPSSFISGEDIRLAIVTCGDNGILGRPNKCNERKSSHSDIMGHETRTRVNDVNGAIVTLGVCSTPCW